MLNYDFKKELERSKAEGKESAISAMTHFFPGAHIEQNTDKTLDKAGCDYIAHYPNGGHYYIDHKMRTPGCSHYWINGEPDVAPEIWSKVPEFGQEGQLGWTLDRKKVTDWVVCTFDKRDTNACYCINYREYREFFWREKDNLIAAGYRVAKQNSGQWRSECIFIPIHILLDSIEVYTHYL